jgi:hypothetical protein
MTFPMRNGAIPTVIKMNQCLASVTIVGGGFGESIVINIGGAFVGIIDFCTAKLANGAQLSTGDILRRMATGAGKPLLGFALLTHPHQDHFSSMDQVLKEHGAYIGRVCLFNAITEGEMMDLFFARTHKPERGASTYRYRRTYQRILDTYRRQLDASQRFSASEGTEICAFDAIQGRTRFPVKISCLAPSVDDCFKFLEEVRFGDFLEIAAGTAARPRQECNRVSVVVKMSFGESSFLFGADAEQGSWRQIEKKYGASLLRSNVFKVSHHGSATGTPQDLIPSLSKKWGPKCQDTVAIVTPASRHGLPHDEQLACLRCNFDEVIVTTAGRSAEGDVALFKAHHPICRDVVAIPQWSQCDATVVFDGYGKRVHGQLPKWAGI